jgi:hypothetical protein
MNAYRHYGIEPGQVYARADGAPGRLIVRDVATCAEVDDVVVYDEAQDKEYRIDAFKLARVRYYLVDFSSGEEKRELLRALHAGEASPNQQRRVAQLFQALQSTLEAQTADARRGRYAVDQGEWRRLDDERDGVRTWLCLRVADHADLSCKGTRALALDAAIRRVEDTTDPAN